MGRGDWRRPRCRPSSRFGSRSSAGSALVMFAIVFFRLWYLQVLSGDNYKAEAQNNQVREFTVQAPRGRDHRPPRPGAGRQPHRARAPGQHDRPARPVEERAARRSLRPPRRGRRPEPEADPPQDPRRAAKDVRRGRRVTLRRDVPYDTVYYLRENQQRFPGRLRRARLRARLSRRAPWPPTCSATSARSTKKSSRTRATRASSPATRSARTGVEYTYDSLLRGVNGATRIQVDAAGQPTGGQLSDPRPADRQQPRADDRRRRPAAPARTRSRPGAAGRLRRDERPQRGAARARLEPLLRPVGVREAAASRSRSTRRSPREATGAPLFDRATNGLYPTGSTFKPITSLAALDSGTIGIGTIINDTGVVPARRRPGAPQRRRCRQRADQPPSRRSRSPPTSSSTTSASAWTSPDSPDGGPLQHWAREPRDRRADRPRRRRRGCRPAADAADGETRTSSATPRPDSPCGEEVCISKGELTDRPWTVGDNVNLAVGQGDLQADPLQMAVAYAGDRQRRRRRPPARRPARRGPQAAARSRRSTRRRAATSTSTRPGATRSSTASTQAAKEPGGTSYPVFGGYPVQIAGKTGTAERARASTSPGTSPSRRTTTPSTWSR